MIRRLLLLAALAACAAPTAGGADATTDLSVKVSITSLDAHAGGAVNVTVQIVNDGSADVADVDWTATFSSNLDPWNAPARGSAHDLGAGQRAFASTSASVLRSGPATIRIAIASADVTDSNPANDVATVHFTALPPKHTFLELHDPVPAPTGTRIAYVRWRMYGIHTSYIGPTTFGRIYVTDGTRSVPVTPTQRVQTGVAWAPDGHALAYASGGRIWTVDLASHRVHRLTSGGPAEERWPAWSPDGTRIVYTTGDRFGVEAAAVIPATGGGAPTVVAYTGSQVGWTPDGNSVVADGRLWDASGSLQTTDTTDVEWARDGKRVLQRDPSTGRWSVADAATGTVIATFPARPVLVRPHLSPHGDTVAAATERGRVALVSVATGRIRYAPRAASADDSARWLASSLAAYVGSGRCGAGSEIDVVRRDGGGARSVARTCA